MRRLPRRQDKQTKPWRECCQQSEVVVQPLNIYMNSLSLSVLSLRFVCKPAPLKNPVLVYSGATNLASVTDTKKAAEAKATALMGPHRFVGKRLTHVFGSSVS
jgi:hypothetical protein